MRTRVGYAGGESRSPTYRRIGDHSETVEIEYDPARVGYEELLRLFWEGHDPLRRSWSSQYRAAVFYHDEEQRRIAERTRDAAAARLGAPVRTEILPAGVFTPAEDYHQKHYLRAHEPLLRELQAAWPEPRDLAASTAAARINGWLGGNGTREQLLAALEALGLSPGAREYLREVVAPRLP